MLAAAIGIAVLVPVTTGFVGVLPHWGNPFAERVVDHSRTPLLLALRDMSQYHAAIGNFQVVVDVEHDTPDVPPFISGERTTFLGIGSVDAMVDFTTIGPDRVTVSPDRRSVTVTLPAAQLADTSMTPLLSLFSVDIADRMIRTYRISRKECRYGLSPNAIELH